MVSFGSCVSIKYNIVGKTVMFNCYQLTFSCPIYWYMLLILESHIQDRNNTTCIVFAALLHYAILVTLFSILGQAVYFIIINWKTKYSVATFIISFGM